MNKEAAAARAAYKRKWAKEHPESVKRSQEKYWTRKAKEMMQKQDEKEGANDDSI